MSMDYGPVPASQMKTEANRVFSALEQGRRVLISRYGKVVAVIQPPSETLHGDMLMAYAVTSPDRPDELTATEIGQGAPGEHIRRAEQGFTSLVTRNSKVCGVLTPYTGDPAAPDPDEEERLLSEFEETHPEATPADFAAEVKRLKDDHASRAEMADWHTITRSRLAQVDDDSEDTWLWGDATLIEAVALEQKGQLDQAVTKLSRLIDRLGGQDDRALRRRAHVARLELARIRASEGDPDAALRIASAVLADLQFGEKDTRVKVKVAAQRRSRARPRV